MSVNGPDSQYIQLYQSIQKYLYNNAGILGFEHTGPHEVSAHTATHGDDPSLKFSTLAELNAECSKWNGGNKDLVGSEESLCVDIKVYTSVPVPLPPTQAPT